MGGGKAMTRKHRNDIKEEGFRDLVCGGGGSIHIGNIYGACEIDFEELLTLALLLVERSPPSNPYHRARQPGIRDC
jgi:hypothetical protein